jgi:hypothetical protein
MTEGSRTATDVLLSLEAKVDKLTYLLQSLDLNNKVLSNKLNTLIAAVNDPSYDQQPFDPSTDPLSIATAKPMKVADEWKPAIPLTSETAPVGFRRTERTETNARTQTRTPAKNTPTPSLPIPEMKAPKSVEAAPQTTGKIPLSQRIVDNKGASLFKADIEVLDTEGRTVWKGQTNATGKWQAALSTGKYRVNVKKQTTQQKIQVSQDLAVSDKTPRELPVMMIK